MRAPLLRSLSICALLLASACSGGSNTGADAEISGDATSDALPDTGDTAADTETDATGGPLDFALHFPIFEPPADSLAGSGVTSCGVYLEERCDGGKAMRCEAYDTKAAAFTDTPDPTFRRAMLYDRWYKLYSSPDGMAGERNFNVHFDPGTPESVWGAREAFSHYSGHGDSAIWTGTMLNGLIMRYLATGTEADYQRMVEVVEVMLRLFDVTRVPGYLARAYSLVVPGGTPIIPEHYIDRRDNPDHFYREIENPEGFDWLPEIYKTGYTDLKGELHKGTPRWRGSPTIDQMNGPMVAFPEVYGLLRDDTLKERIAHHMTCYVKRLRRIEIRNLQTDPELIGALQAALSEGAATSGPNGTPSDAAWSFDAIDTIVMYVTPQLNSKNEGEFDRSCPETWDHTPWRVLDVTDDDFTLDLFGLVQDLDAKKTERKQSADHFYAINVRGADAMHMMHLALMAYAFSGDQQFLDFLKDEALGPLHADKVATTMSSFLPSRWCRKFYSTNITTGPFWAFLNLLGDSPLKTHMQKVMHDEMWLKESATLGKLDFQLMYAGALPPEIGTAHDEVLSGALTMLHEFGGNGGVMDDPRRTYHRPFPEIAAATPASIKVECPTAAIRARCEDGISLFGVTVPGETMTFKCTGADWECDMGEGRCAEPMAATALPMAVRRYGDYTWQRSPYQMHMVDGSDGREQSPGIDLTESYWLARFYGFVPESAGLVLGWREVADAGQCSGQ